MSERLAAWAGGLRGWGRRTYQSVRVLWNLEDTVVVNAWVLWLLLKLDLLPVAARALNLLEASLADRHDLCQMLLDHGVEVHKIDENTKLTPILVASMSGSCNSLAVLLSGGDTAAMKKSLLQGDPKSRCPLYHAAKGGHIHCVKKILACCTRIGLTESQLLDVVDTVGHTPLHAACLGIHPEVVEALLAVGAKVNALGRDGCSPIMLLTRTRPSTSLAFAEMQKHLRANDINRGKITSSLLAGGAQIDLRDCFGAGLVHLACGGCGCQISNAILEEVHKFDAALLQKHGKDIDNDGMNPFHILCQRAGTLQDVELSNDEDPSDTSENLFQTSFVSLCEFLLAHDVEVGETDYSTTTPLMTLAWGKSNSVSVELARILLDSKKCDPRVEHEGWSVLHISWNREGRSELFEVFESFMSTYYPDYLKSFDPEKPRTEDVNAQQRRIGINNQFTREERRDVLKGNHNVEGIARFISSTIQSKGLAKIVVLSGAGISVSSGIPDFRSPGTGLYATDKYKNSFNREALASDPTSIWSVIKDVFGGVLLGQTKPSLAHCFIKMLDEKGILLRNFTQNIDMLESKVGIPKEKTVEAHGTIARAVCMKCGHETSIEEIQSQFLDNACTAPRCLNSSCSGIYRPDVVLFGEPLNPRFFDLSAQDIKNADVLIVMGTSLKVYPFAGIVNEARPLAPRILINKTPSGPFERLKAFPEAFKLNPSASSLSIPSATSTSIHSRMPFVQKIFGSGGGDASKTKASQLKPSLCDASFTSNAQKKSDSMLSCSSDTMVVAAHELSIEDTSSYRDAIFLGDCDEGVRELAKYLGWEQELLDMHFNL